ncbi:hypothetical protein [Williamsia sp.]|uniref:hypothetical protein n=1 Tax=Williamsia sp. TaxID=1872085 RepID=UPI001A1F3916|nr:hypothetical protein [Williamsia sp.]MBJ7289400.1 hypothetical protein [Williamsia sp.]
MDTMNPRYTYTVLKIGRTAAPLRANTSDVTYASLESASAVAERAHPLTWDSGFTPPEGYRTARVTTPKNRCRQILIVHPVSATLAEILDAWHAAANQAINLSAIRLTLRAAQARNSTHESRTA